MNPSEGLREQRNARRRRWYRENLEQARALARNQQRKRYAKNPEKLLAASERSRVKRGLRNRRFIEAYKVYFGCQRCGERDPVVLDLHHREQGSKEFTVSKWLWRASLKALAKELEKCEVLCANDHRRKHRENELLHVEQTGLGR